MVIILIQLLALVLLFIIEAVTNSAYVAKLMVDRKKRADKEKKEKTTAISKLKRKFTQNKVVQSAIMLGKVGVKLFLSFSKLVLSVMLVLQSIILVIIANIAVFMFSFGLIVAILINKDLISFNSTQRANSNSTAVVTNDYYDPTFVNAETKNIPPNKSNNRVVYYSQNASGGGGEWSAVPFGGGTIASSGCSVTSIAMVLSYNFGGEDKTKWVFPNNIVAKIAENNNGDYNRFYVGNAGQSHDIFPAIARYYGIKQEKISSSSIHQALAEGNPVIQSCDSGEFTNGGHFIVITGFHEEEILDDDGNVIETVYKYWVNDPSHPEKSSVMYDLEYLLKHPGGNTKNPTGGAGKGWWIFPKN